jgi:glutathione synthase/RimK-type ligase-like ATP-grasp enzyme
VILILTHKIDLCADLAIPRLQERGQRALRVNLEDYPLDIALTYHPGGKSTPQLIVYGKAFDLSAIDAVWYRVPFEYSARRWAEDHQLTRFIESSCNHMWYPLELFLHCFWFDRPLSVLKASYKLHQLETAVRVGLHIPQTCATNDPDAVRSFYESVGGNMAVKTMCGGGIHIEDKVFVVYTNAVSAADMDHIGSVRDCPCQFQEYVAKEFELRVIVVGDRTFAIEIHSQQSEKTKHDWRHYDLQNVAHRAHKLPADIEARCIALTRSLELNYGAIDMIVTPNGEYVFLEINPTGQYQWLEAMTGLPITDSIVETLICGAARKDGVQPASTSDNA